MLRYSLLVILLLGLRSVLSAQEIVNYTSIADLQANPGSRNRVAFVKSMNASSVWFWDDASTLAADGTSVVSCPSIATGRWLSTGMQNAAQMQSAMKAAKFVTTLYTALTPKAVVATAGVETSALPAPIPIPASSNQVGRVYELETFGSYQTPAAPGAVTVNIKLGGVIIAQAVVAASILAGNSSYFELYGKAVISVRSLGTSGAVVCNGEMSFATATMLANVPFSTARYATSAGATATINTTIDNNLDVTETWGAPTGGGSQGTTIVQVSLKQVN